MADVLLRATPTDAVYVLWTIDEYQRRPTEIWYSRAEAAEAGMSQDSLDRADIYGTSIPMLGMGWDERLLVVTPFWAQDENRLLHRHEVAKYAEAESMNDPVGAERYTLSVNQGWELILAQKQDPDFQPSTDPEIGWPRLPTNPVAWSAERALLGALLRRPSHTANISSFLRPDDFQDYAHRAIFAGVTKAVAASNEATDEEVLKNAVVYAESHANTRLYLVPDGTSEPRHELSPAYLGGLREASPNPENAADYARTVLEGRIRRDLAVHARRLGLIATRAMQTLDVDDISQAATVLRHAADQLGARAGKDIPLTDMAGRVVPVSTTEGIKERAGVELAFVGALIADPRLVDRVRGWLAPEDFTSLSARELYAASLAIAQRGDRLDVVTLAAEAGRRGVLRPELPPSLDPADLVQHNYPVPGGISVFAIAIMPEVLSPDVDPLEVAQNILGGAISDRSYDAATSFSLVAINNEHSSAALTGAAIAIADMVEGDMRRMNIARTTPPPPLRPQAGRLLRPPRPRPPTPGGPAPQPGS